VDGTIILTLVVKKYCVKMSNLSNWIRTESSDWLLCVEYGNEFRIP
jgi:hypothetical protein